MLRKMRAAKARIHAGRRTLKGWSEEIDQVSHDLLNHSIILWWAGATWIAFAAAWIVVDFKAAAAVFGISIAAIVLAAMVVSPIVWLAERTKRWFFNRHLR